MGSIPFQGSVASHQCVQSLDWQNSLTRFSQHQKCFLRSPWQKKAPPVGCSSISKGRGGKESLLSRSFELRATASDSDSILLKNSVEQVEKMRASTIKDELTKLGISYADCFEKQELVIRLATARVNNYKSKSSDPGSSSIKTYKPLIELPITRLQNTINAPKNYILVPLKINDQGPFNFILDTGSTVTLVQPSIVEKLKLPLRPAQQSLALLGGGLSNHKVMTANFSDVKIGSYSMRNISALLMDQNMLQGWDPLIAGLLGLNVLSLFDVEFDFKKEALVFHPAGATGRREFDTQDLEKLDTSEITLGILGVKVALGRALPEMALLDLGSSLCVACPDIARLAGVPENIINSKNPALGGGGIGQPGSMQFSSAYVDISMITANSKSGAAVGADFTVKGTQFAIGEIPALRAVGCRILLGLNLFKNMRMIFCQSTKSIYMQKRTKM